MNTEASQGRRRVTLERSLKATMDEVWELWTTRDGIESWWGPEGFRVEVRSIDLRVGGDLDYDMIAIGVDQVDFLRKAGMKISTPNTMTFSEVEPPRRLAYTHMADFIPGVPPYRVHHEIDIEERGGAVVMRLTFDAMHDQHWTEMATRGWEMELDKLERLITERRGRPTS
jgi:uncharacterized protein YndB with AHSA1/START domain